MSLTFGQFGAKKSSALILEGCPCFRSVNFKSFGVKIWSVLNIEVFLFQRIGVEGFSVLLILFLPLPVLAVGYDNGSVCLFSVEDGRPLHEFSAGASISSLQWALQSEER